MVLIVCLRCKKEFAASTNTPSKHYNPPGPTQTTPVLTVCGHYYHWNCLEASFLYENFKMENHEGHKRRMSCPYPMCNKDLSNTTLTKIRPIKVEETEYDKRVTILEDEIADLKKRLQDCRPFELGDKVIYINKNSSEEHYGTVTGITVEIECENSTESFGNNNNVTSPTSTTHSGSSWRESLTKKLRRNFSHRDTSVAVPIENVKLAISNREDSKSPNTDKSSAFLKPKWAAGDRIYLPKEKEFATIKWIGSRQYKFIVAIEYDQPVGDDKFDSEDLPFLIPKGHGRQMVIEELNNTAEKAELSSPASILNSFFRWGSGHKKRGRPSPVFYVDRTEEPQQSPSEMDSNPKDIPVSNIKDPNAPAEVPVTN